MVASLQGDFRFEFRYRKEFFTLIINRWRHIDTNFKTIFLAPNYNNKHNIMHHVVGHEIGKD